MRIVSVIIFLLVLISCRQTQPDTSPVVTEPRPVIPAHRVRQDDTAVHLANGVWQYHAKPYSGQLVALYPSGKIKSILLLWQGKEEGLQTTYYEDGMMATARWYRGGEKDSVNQGWWPNGQQKFLYHFRKGEYEGSFEEWYVSGKPMKKILYYNGKEESGQGWRENGKPYMSFVVKEGRWYGLINPNLCYSLRNEKGDFAAVRQ